MGSGIVAIIANALWVAKKWLGLQSKKLDLKNAADVKDAAVRQNEQSAVDKTNKAIANKDADEIRNELAE